MAVENAFPDRMDPVLDLLNQRPRENWQWRFEPEAASHSPINALALGNVALLAYSDQTGIRHFFEKWHLSEVCFLRGFDTQGFVARQDNVIIIAFRGTRTSQRRRLALGYKLSPTQVAPECAGPRPRWV